MTLSPARALVLVLLAVFTLVVVWQAANHDAYGDRPAYCEVSR